MTERTYKGTGQHTPARVATRGGYFPDFLPEERARILLALGREPEDDDPMQDDILYLATCGCVSWGPADDDDGLLSFCQLHAAAPALLEAAQRAVKSIENNYRAVDVEGLEALLQLRAAIAAVEGRKA